MGNIYVGQSGSSTIAYVIVNENCKDIVNKFKVIGRSDSDHIFRSQALLLVTKGRRRRRDNKEEEERKEERRRIYSERRKISNYTEKELKRQIRNQIMVVR